MNNKYQVRNIIVPLDFSESSIEAFKEALSMAKSFETSIHLVHVMNFSAQVFPWSSEVIDYEKITQNIETKIKEMIAELNSENVAITYEIREGSVTKEVLLAAQSKEASLILMSTHGASGIEEFFIGSNASKLVASSPIPVLSLRPNSKGLEFKNIAMPIDNTIHTRDKAPQVTALAQKYGSMVHIGVMMTDDDEDEVKRSRLRVKQLQDHFDLNGVKYTTQELSGDDIVEMTLIYSDSKHVDLVAIMTDQEAGANIFVGSNAQRIVNKSKRPVLSVAPRGSSLGINQQQGRLQGSSNPFN